MTAAVTCLTLVPLAAQAERGAASPSGAAGAGTPSALLSAERSVGSARVSAPEHCPHAKRAIRFYSARIAQHAAKLGAGPAKPLAREQAARLSCPRYLAKRLRAKAYAWRERWERYRTLRDFDVRPGYSGWRMAVDEVQKVYPGTRAWLLSCSASEGGWGRWVWNTQGSGCGGWLQFMQPTFNGFSGRALSDVRRRGFRVPASAHSWLSPLGQALAGAWAYSNGLSHHWFGSGC